MKEYSGSYIKGLVGIIVSLVLKEQEQFNYQRNFKWKYCISNSCLRHSPAEKVTKEIIYLFIKLEWPSVCMLNFGTSIHPVVLVLTSFF